MPLDLLVGDDAIWVLTADNLQDSLTVEEWRVWTSPSLEMMSQPACTGKVDFAEWTGHLRAAVDLRVQMLYTPTLVVAQPSEKRGCTILKLFSF